MQRGGRTDKDKVKTAEEESHHVYDHLSQRLPLLLGEVLEDVAVVLLQELEAHGQVVVL